jgi:hypothetical protein
MDLVKNPDHIASFLIQIRHLLLDFLQQVSIGDQGGSPTHAYLPQLDILFQELVETFYIPRIHLRQAFGRRKSCHLHHDQFKIS